MADILLTHSYHLPYDAKQLRKMQPYVPIGTLYAATALRDRGFSVAVFDAMLETPAEKFKAMLQQHQPQIVAVYEDDFNFLSKMCLTRMREVAWEIAQAAREIGAIVLVHGSDSTDNPDLFLANGFDYVLCGEAEEVLVELCHSIINNTELPKLDGLVRLDEHMQTVRSQQHLAKNPAWSDLSLPARDLIDLAPYRAAWLSAHGYFSTNMVASRGCPFRCNWCAKPISGNRFHLRAASTVADEMELLKRAGVQHIWFGDDVFALNHHWVSEFAAEVTKRNASIPFKVQSRADLMGEETVLHLKEAGCAEVWMGVESGAQKILDAMDKGITLDTIIAARNRLKDAGIRACFFLQFGYPGETWTELQQTISFVRKMRPDDIGISFSYPLPGTLFYERVQAQLGTKRNWTDSDDLCIMFSAAYTTDFYRAVREALHAEVDSWQEPEPSQHTATRVADLWRKVEQLEPVSRDADAFTFPETIEAFAPPVIVPVEQLLPLRKA
ncbi:B12-binding domain-containing radical SAM protein [Granulicella sp. WH15]|uniref:B12-binding domain-containing radical SAM protein n=1 Tax=Granulicella sp. WH15 TaxID=2602070 RepID=UPI001366BE5A|nr:radical SAM protein [Granulicella sp. WH15]QHN04976.1 B12-binding domain-containing radical SAM protein [Granulicella sp. WH15]